MVVIVRTLKVCIRPISRQAVLGVYDLEGLLGNRVTFILRPCEYRAPSATVRNDLRGSSVFWGKAVDSIKNFAIILAVIEHAR